MMAVGLALATQLYDIYIPFKFELDEWMDIGQDTGHMWSSQYPLVLYAMLTFSLITTTTTFLPTVQIYFI